METEYLTVSQYAKKVGKDGGNIRKLIAAGRIPGIKMGSQWLIPADALYPADGRVKSGKYVKPKD